MNEMTETTKEKILNAAMKEFSTHGLAGARVDEIARSAGVNKAMIYYHFASKEELFRQLFQSEMDNLRTQVGELLRQRDPTSAEDMANVVHELLAYIRTKKDLLTLLMSETIQPTLVPPLFFQLLDLSTAMGQNIVLSSRPEVLPTEEPVFYELFTGLLPLLYFDRLLAYYNWDTNTLDDRFITFWLKQHGKF
jgi:AcrR family transcriptional regulator